MRDWSVPACSPGTLQFPTRSFPVWTLIASLRSSHHLSLQSRRVAQYADGPGHIALGRSAIEKTEIGRPRRFLERASNEIGTQDSRLQSLLAEPESRNRRSVAFDILRAKVSQKTPSASDHLQQAAARMVIVPVRPQMIGQAVDALREQRDLNFRRTGVGVMQPVAGDDLLFLYGLQRHCGDASSAVAPYCVRSPPRRAMSQRVSIARKGLRLPVRHRSARMLCLKLLGLMRLPRLVGPCHDESMNRCPDGRHRTARMSRTT
jgi:hypothetical protein